MAADYKELLVWQKSMKLAKEIYTLCELLPKKEQFALADQMRRAAISIPSNIAEGHARCSNKEFAYFLNVANGSKAELETQWLFGVEVGYFSNEQIKAALGLCTETSKMLQALKTAISS